MRSTNASPLQTGGQDDLITIISPRESRVVARGQGHASYVTGIAFDRRRTNARSYRFGSVGEDGRILLVSHTKALQDNELTTAELPVGLFTSGIAETAAHTELGPPVIYRLHARWEQR